MKPSSGLEPETPSLPCDAIDERMGPPNGRCTRSTGANAEASRCGRVRLKGAAFRRTARKAPAIFDEAQWVVPVVAAFIALFIRL